MADAGLDGAAAGRVHNITRISELRSLQASHEHVALLFTGGWSAEAKRMNAKFEHIAATDVRPAAMAFAKVDVDASNEDISIVYPWQRIPTVLVSHGHQVVGQSSCAADGALEHMLQRSHGVHEIDTPAANKARPSARKLKEVMGMVFNTIELLENILRFLSTDSLIICQWVCYRWQDLIKRSSVLQDIYCWHHEPWQQPDPEICWLGESTINERLISRMTYQQEQVEVNPAIKDIIPVDEIVISKPEPGSSRRRYTLEIVPNLKVRLLQLPYQPHRGSDFTVLRFISVQDPSWHNAFLTQPPITAIVLIHSFRWSRRAEGFVIRNPTGLTLADVHEHFAKHQHEFGGCDSNVSLSFCVEKPEQQYVPPASTEVLDEWRRNTIY